MWVSRFRLGEVHCAGGGTRRSGTVTSPGGEAEVTRDGGARTRQRIQWANPVELIVGGVSEQDSSLSV